MHLHSLVYNIQDVLDHRGQIVYPPEYISVNLKAVNCRIILHEVTGETYSDIKYVQKSSFIYSFISHQ